MALEVVCRFVPSVSAVTCTRMSLLWRRAGSGSTGRSRRSGRRRRSARRRSVRRFVMAVRGSAQDPRRVLFGRIGQAAGAPASRAGHVGLRRAGEVFELPQAGSPLMQQLVRFVQARNPAVVVNEGNVGEYVLGQPSRGLFNWGLPGRGRQLLWSLVRAGLAREPSVRTRYGLQPLSVFHRGGGGYTPTSYPGDVMWQPSPSGGGVSAPQVPVATLPEPQVPLTSGGVGVQASPLAVTPAGPMFYPPGPSPLGSRDPRRR